MSRYDEATNSTTLGYSLATQFAAFGLPDPAASVGNWLRDDLGGAEVQYILRGDQTSSAPRYILAKVGSKTLVVIQCTENNLSALGLWNGWLNGEAMTGAGVMNAHLESAARSIYEYMLETGYMTQDVLITGHSQGGAIANVLHRLIFTNVRTTSVRTVTFGAPKSGGVGTYTGLNGSRICRWMTPDDPVPLLPPESALASIGGALGNREQARRMTYFAQPAGGRLLYADPPGIREGVIPPVATLPSIGNFTGWLVGVESASAPHRIATYSARLAAWNAIHVRPSEQRPSGGPAQRPNPATAREMTQQERIFVQNAFQAGSIQQRVVLEQPKTSLFYAVRQGRIWSVWLNNQQVALGPTKKRARGIARLGNYFLTRLQRSAYVDQATLIEQVGAVIATMADPASGFRPPMRVVLPAAQ